MLTAKLRSAWIAWQRIRRLMEPVRQYELPLLLLILVMQVLQLLSPYVFKLILDTLTHLGPPTLHHLYVLLGVMGALSIVVSLFRRIRDIKISRLIYTIDRILPVQAQAKLLALPLPFHESRETGQLVGQIDRGVSRLTDLGATMYFDFVPTFLQTIGTIVFLFILDWRVALVFSPVIPFLVWLTVRMNNRIRPLRRERYKGYEQADGMLAQSLYNVNTVQSYVQEEREVAQHAELRQLLSDLGEREWVTMLNMNFFRDTLVTIGRICVIGAAALLLMRGQVTFGSLVLFASLSESAYTSLYRLLRLADQASDWMEAINRLQELLNEPPQVVESPDAVDAESLRGEITFDHVTLDYGSGRNALHDVSCTIRPGQTVALVGPSGGGKTTIVKLALRHWDPSAGRVLIDGRPLTQLTKHSYRSQMALVPQKTEMFNETVAYNIAYGNPDASIDNIVNAARQANAHEFINALEHGYETIIGEQGVKLSGGQAQRIGIARALLTNPRIIFFDEATSSLDSETEALIQDALRSISRDRTMVIIAHRLSTVRHADRILVFDDGMIVERGTHNELVAQNGVYANLHSLQNGDPLSPSLLSPVTV